MAQVIFKHGKIILFLFSFNVCAHILLKAKRLFFACSVWLVLRDGNRERKVTEDMHTHTLNHIFYVNVEVVQSEKKP